MILTITFLVVAWLHPVQPTVVTELHQTQARGIELGPAHPTAVKTWEIR